MNTIATIAGVIEAVAFIGLCILMWRVSQTLTENVDVLRGLHKEAQDSAVERERRREGENIGAIYDAQRVREAEFILKTLDTDQNCYPCRDVVQRGVQRLRDRLRVSPRERA